MVKRARGAFALHPRPAMSLQLSAAQSRTPGDLLNFLAGFGRDPAYGRPPQQQQQQQQHRRARQVL